MTKPTKLKWGQTPFDTMTPEQMKIELCRMWMAVITARSVLGLDSKLRDPESPYWNASGSGGRALRMCDQVVKGIEAKYDSESIFRSFFRYAEELLFTGDLANRPWMICDTCEQMTSPGPKDNTCPFCETDRKLGPRVRKLTLEDLRAK